MDDVPEVLDSFALAARLGISVRTLRSWVKARAIPRPPRRGHGSRFDRQAIIYAHAVAALRRDGVPLPHVGRFLATKSDRELRELGGLPQPRTVSPALPAPAEPPEQLATDERHVVSGEQVVSHEQMVSDELDVRAHLAVRGTPLVEQGPEAESRGAPIGSEWRRIELLPGLELHVRADASPFVHGLAAAIAAGRLAK